MDLSAEGESQGNLKLPEGINLTFNELATEHVEGGAEPTSTDKAAATSGSDSVSVCKNKTIIHLDIK